MRAMRWGRPLVVAAPPTATAATTLASVIGPVPAAAMIIAWRIVRAVSPTAVIVARLDLTGGGPAQGGEAYAGSHQGGQAHHGLPPCQCARCFFHRTPALHNDGCEPGWRRVANLTHSVRLPRVVRNRQESPTLSMLRSRSGSDQSLIDRERSANA